MTPEQAAEFARTFARMADNVETVLHGKREVVELVLQALFAEGHVLLEDAPGTGKTRLARALAATIGGAAGRIQFTPDLLPSDVTGVTIFDQNAGRFLFHPGPVFAQVLLADEINRASPKTQSALLEVMEESRVTVDGTAHEVGRPFLVIATQNPVEQLGTYRLPEAQLDRFLVKTSIGYPSVETTWRILAAAGGRDADPGHVVTSDEFAALADAAAGVHAEEAVLRYIAELVEATRHDVDTALGVSVRGAIAMARLARVRAASSGRTYALPDDVKALAVAVWAHRIVLDPEAEYTGATRERVIERALARVAAPRAR